MRKNHPPGENLGPWVMCITGTAANDWTVSQVVDSPAEFHGASSPFSWADGRATSRRWLNGAKSAYAASMNPNEYVGLAGIPASSALNDTTFLVNGYSFVGNE